MNLTEAVNGGQFGSLEELFLEATVNGYCSLERSNICRIARAVWGNDSDVSYLQEVYYEVFKQIAIRSMQQKLGEVEYSRLMSANN